MVEAYWNIGKSIIEEQGGNEKAEYGIGLLSGKNKEQVAAEIQVLESSKVEENIESMK